MTSSMCAILRQLPPCCTLTLALRSSASGWNLYCAHVEGPCVCAVVSSWRACCTCCSHLDGVLAGTRSSGTYCSLASSGGANSSVHSLMRTFFFCLLSRLILWLEGNRTYSTASSGVFAFCSAFSCANSSSSSTSKSNDSWKSSSCGDSTYSSSFASSGESAYSKASAGQLCPSSGSSTSSSERSPSREDSDGVLEGGDERLSSGLHASSCLLIATLFSRASIHSTYVRGCSVSTHISYSVLSIPLVNMSTT